MEKLLIGALCLSLGLLAACSWGRRPKEAIPIGDISGMNALADDEKLHPFVRSGQLLYEKERIDRTDSLGTGVARFELGHLIYDGTGKVIAETPPADSTRHMLPSFGKTRFDTAAALTFSGSLSPTDQLIYPYKFYGDRGLMLYDFSMQEPPQTVEFFSLPDLCSMAEEHRNTLSVDDAVRERLRRAGCILPKEVDAPRWNTTPWREVDHKQAQQDMNEGKWIKVTREYIRATNRQNKEDKRFKGVLAAHLDSLQAEYERTIEQFVAANREGAYTFLFNPDDSFFTRGEMHPREYVVLPERGFAFELTSGMNFGDLPAATAEPLPQWDKKRKDVVLRRTGRKLQWQFTPVAFIPIWTRYYTYYYELSVAGEKWPVTSPDKLQILDVIQSGEKTYFSLIDETGLARLYFYDKTR
jgi:hypothetical protein